MSTQISAVIVAMSGCHVVFLLVSTPSALLKVQLTQVSPPSTCLTLPYNCQLYSSSKIGIQ